MTTEFKTLSEKIFTANNQSKTFIELYNLEIILKEFIKVVEDDYEKEWDKATDEDKIIDKNKLKEILIKRAGDKLKW